MKKSVLLVLTVVVFFILSGFTVYPESNLNSEMLISGNTGESGLSFKYENAIGTPNKPYIFSGSHINKPEGLFVDSTGALYVAETDGMQVLKYNSSGAYERSFGVYGQPWQHDNFLNKTRSVTVNSSGHVFVSYLQAIKEYDQFGDVVRSYPEKDQWESGSDNGHFDDPYDLVFNEDESLLFVSDIGNHRVQIFSFDTDGNFVYEETISEATANMLDGDFNGIRGLDMDSSGRLYVVDFDEHVVQRCEKAAQWQCADFMGIAGTPGDDLNQLNWPVDVYVDQSNAILIVDAGNNRVLKCNDSGVCTNFLNLVYGSGDYQSTWLNGITGDSLGNIYVSDCDNFRVQVFDSTGNYLKTYGTTGVPYLTDKNYLNEPAGIALDSDGSIVIVESLGRRLIKYDANGNFLWQVGEAGFWGDDNAHFGSNFGGMEGNPAIDKNHNIYVADTQNNRIQVFDQNGVHIRSLGSYGQGAAHFDFPTHVYVDQSTGDIYVSDTFNHRIQIFNSNFTYKNTIGVTAEAGSDNIHFWTPQGVVVDSDGYVYVADFDNNRVQKCGSHDGAYSCETFIGETGVHNGNFGQLYPYSIATDHEGRFYISDRWEWRIQIFDSNGAFLTSIEGNHSADMNEPTSLAVNEDGLLYVANKNIHA
ncbi:MAG: 6-bladed beta-propeller, partial [Candidatus Cloacimonetes bacterium]|nr:6-bladed beta-propeller [Candidatus Cloacimonadota bacterium]MDY0230693.1 NHL repeat-containing protein [Candidatus Cloacimonadaceae bacterium]